MNILPVAATVYEGCAARSEISMPNTASQAVKPTASVCCILYTGGVQHCRSDISSLQTTAASYPAVHEHSIVHYLHIIESFI